MFADYLGWAESVRREIQYGIQRIRLEDLTLGDSREDVAPRPIAAVQSELRQAVSTLAASLRAVGEIPSASGEGDAAARGD